MHRILMSACFLGRPVRHDGRALTLADEIVARWFAEGRVVSVCPEVEAGMSVPRKPSEIVGGSGSDVLAGQARLLDVDGEEVTPYFECGARLALATCRAHDIGVAVLTDGSPSCGSAVIHDGRFAGRKTMGEGVTTALLRTHGVQVFSQHEIAEADQFLARMAPMNDAETKRGC